MSGTSTFLSPFNNNILIEDASSTMLVLHGYHTGQGEWWHIEICLMFIHVGKHDLHAYKNVEAVTQSLSSISSLTGFVLHAST